MKKPAILPRPTLRQVEAELKRMEEVRRFRAALKSTVFVLLAAAAAAVLAATLWFPVLQVSGNAMSPALQSGDMVLCSSAGEPRKGEVIAFYHNNKLLLRRITALPGEVVEEKEVYITQDVDIDFPLTVPEGCFFVSSEDPAYPDSRQAELGCIPRERILGRVLLRFFPLDRFGSISS